MICTVDGNAQENTSASSYKRDEVEEWAKNKLKNRRRSHDTEPPKTEEKKRNRGKREGNTGQKQGHHRIASSSPPR